MKSTKYTIDIEVNNKEADLAIQGTAKEVKELDQANTDALDNIDNLSGGLISNFQNVTKVITGSIKALKTLRGVLIATGIAGFALAVASVSKAFTNSEEGQNRFAKLMGQIAVVTGNVFDILENLGKSILNLGQSLKFLVKGDLGNAALAFKEVRNNISDATDQVKNFGEETRKEIAIAGELADQRAKADKIERQLLVDRAKADRDRADLLEKAVDLENYTVQERIGFLQEASALEEEITNKEIRLAEIRLNAKIEENKLSGSTKEDLQEEAELRAQLITLETTRLSKQKEVTSQIITLKNEEKAANEAASKAAQDEIDKQEEALRSFEEQELEALAITEELKTELAVKKSNERYDKLIKLAKEFGKDTYELETARIIAEQDIRIGASEDEVDLVEGTEKAKHDVLLKFTAIGLALATEGSNAGKALAIANALISTYAGAAQVLDDKTLPLIAKIAGVATVLTTGFTQIRAIQQTQIPVLSVGGVTGGAGSAPAPQIQPPSFNVVGASPINQLTEAIAGQTNQPIRAYVVSNDVTTQQSVDRNIVQTAGI